MSAKGEAAFTRSPIQIAFRPRLLAIATSPETNGLEKAATEDLLFPGLDRSQEGSSDQSRKR